MALYYSLWGRLKRQSRRAKALEILSIVLVLVLMFAAIWWIWLRLVPAKDSADPASSKIVTQTFAAKVRNFDTQYFHFQAPDTWQAVAAESKDGVYVYRGFRSTLVEQDLTIYVNQSLEVPKVSRILPVQISSNGMQVNGSVTDHCNLKTPKIVQPRIVTQERVKFLCDSDGTIFSVLVGEQNGSGVLNLPRSNGQPAHYIIIYTDLTANPVGRDLSQIVRSFNAL